MQTGFLFFKSYYIFVIHNEYLHCGELVPIPFSSFLLPLSDPPSPLHPYVPFHLYNVYLPVSNSNLIFNKELLLLVKILLSCNMSSNGSTLIKS